jgi:hypothetical protein
MRKTVMDKTTMDKIVVRFMQRIVAAMTELLREISDQNAYARHLTAHGAVHSGAEWRRFSDERFRMKYQQVKCC